MALPVQNFSSNTYTQHNKPATTPLEQITATGDKIKYESLPIPLTQPKLNISVNKINDIVQSINPYVTLDSDVQSILVELGNDFITNVANAACKLAKHRNSTTLDMKDIELYLSKQYGLTVPYNTSAETTHTHNNGTSADKSLNPLLTKSIQKSRVLESHRRRLQLIQKSKQRENMKQLHTQRTDR